MGKEHAIIEAITNNGLDNYGIIIAFKLICEHTMLHSIDAHARHKFNFLVFVLGRAIIFFNSFRFVQFSI